MVGEESGRSEEREPQAICVGNSGFEIRTSLQAWLVMEKALVFPTKTTLKYSDGFFQVSYVHSWNKTSGPLEGEDSLVTEKPCPKARMGRVGVQLYVLFVKNPKRFSMTRV